VKTLDEDVWHTIDPDDLWVYDKLILARKMGYVCGPVGTSVPTPGQYIVRPITNILGMGRGARIIHIDEDTDHLAPSHFWCEVFTGRHLTVDYHYGEQVLCVEGFRTSKKLYKWDRWEVVDDRVPLPGILAPLTKYGPMNCEFIGGHLIEAHLRGNPDFNGESEVHVVWEGDDISPPPGMTFVESKDYKRLGFFVPIVD
jgi:hypothetical protein